MAHSHSHHDAAYWSRRHTESVVLDIGGDVGALVLYAPAALHRREIEVSLVGAESGAGRVHSAVLERSLGDHVFYAATYPELPAGEYEVCCEGAPRFTITPGTVTEVRVD
jgi:hypothetical protein